MPSKSHKNSAMNTVLNAVVTKVKVTTKTAKTLFHCESWLNPDSSILDPSNGGMTNLLTTNDTTETKHTTPYTYRITWGWERVPEAELNYYAWKNAEADRQLTRALEQDQKRVGKKRKRLQKKLKAAVHASF